MSNSIIKGKEKKLPMIQQPMAETVRQLSFWHILNLTIKICIMTTYAYVFSLLKYVRKTK